MDRAKNRLLRANDEKCFKTTVVRLILVKIRRNIAIWRNKLGKSTAQPQF